MSDFININLVDDDNKSLDIDNQEGTKKIQRHPLKVQV